MRQQSVLRALVRRLPHRTPLRMLELARGGEAQREQVSRCLGFSFSGDRSKAANKFASLDEITHHHRSRLPVKFAASSRVLDAGPASLWMLSSNWMIIMAYPSLSSALV